jgi:hypothetical protein
MGQTLVDPGGSPGDRHGRATYDDRVPVLPASVRLALWTTAAWNGTGGSAPDLPTLLGAALPDVDHVAGDLARLELWHDLGERALLVALPAPGDLAGLPTAAPEARGAAATAGECVYVPGLGGMLVPTVAGYGQGPGPDSGTRVDWQAFDADPVPRHRVEALEASSLERHLRQELLVATERLEAVGGRPFAAQVSRELADAALGGEWGLPPGLPSRALRAITVAGSVGRVVDLALDGPDDALDAGTSQARRHLLLGLQRTADRALADAANAASAVLAGWRPA